MALRIAIVGAGGRMGRQLIQAVQNTEGVVLGASFERKGSSLVGADAGELAGIGHLGIQVGDDLNAAKEQFDVLIDFTRPEGTLEHLAFCVANQKNIIIGTTGFDDAGKAAIKAASEHIGVVFASNFSVGVNLVFKLLEKAAKVMGDYCDIEIIEAHHRHKVDAPSGTALSMGEHIAKTLGRDLKTHGVFCRDGIIGERKRDEIGFSTIRASDVVGEHSIWFADIGERVEIAHKASSRMTFANGAVRAAKLCEEKKKCFFVMECVFVLKNQKKGGGKNPPFLFSFIDQSAVIFYGVFKVQSPNLLLPDNNTIKSHLVVKRLTVFPHRTLCLFLFLLGRNRNSHCGIGIHGKCHVVPSD